MKHRCGCGNDTFTVEVYEYDAHARTSQSTHMTTKVDHLVCTDCGREQSV